MGNGFSVEQPRQLAPRTEKRREWAKKYYLEHKSEYRERDRKYYRANPQKSVEELKKYREKNPEHVREYRKKYYALNREKISMQRKDKWRKYYEECRSIRDKAKMAGCQICGITDDCLAIFDFHHNDESKKEHNIARIFTANRLIEEIKKCMVVCSNCHRKLHHPVQEVA